MSSIRYEIQSLRGVSILAVICFHLAKDQFPNGYLGVDIFFVISGYLISSLLFKEYEINGKINFKNFFIRRGFKIYPLLYLLVLITLLLNKVYNL